MKDSMEILKELWEESQYHWSAALEAFELYDTTDLKSDYLKGVKELHMHIGMDIAINILEDAIGGKEEDTK